MKPCVLVADSEKPIRDLYEEYFPRFGYRVETSADGLECIDKLRQCQPEAAVIDLELTWGNGDGVFAMLRDGSLPFVPILIATGDERPDRLSERTGLPVDYCFQKPFSFSLLNKQIQFQMSERVVEPWLA